MSKFDKKYDCDKKIEKAKKFIIIDRYEEAKQILNDCYQYYDDEHLDNEKLKILLLMIEVYQNLKDFDSMKYHLEEYKEIALENNLIIPYEIYHDYGIYWSKKGDLDKAIENLRIAVNNTNLLHAANSYLQLGQFLRTSGNFEEAILALRTSLNLFFNNGGAQFGLKVLITIVEMIVNMRGRPFQFDIDGVATLIESIPLPRNSTTASTYLNLALAFQRFGRVKEAVQYNLKTIQVCNEIGNEGIKYHSSMNLGGLYCELGEYTNAIERLIDSFNFFEKQEDYELMAQSLNQLAFVYREMKDYDEALKYLKKSIDLSKNRVNFDLNLRNSEMLADIYYLN